MNIGLKMTSRCCNTTQRNVSIPDINSVNLPEVGQRNTWCKAWINNFKISQKK